jgi:hypothetical protein
MPDNYTAPSISAEFARETERIARQMELDHPNSIAHQEHAAFLRASIAGLAPKAAVDPRTVEQIRHDRAFGVTLAGDRPMLPEHLAAVIGRDVATAPAKEIVERHLDATGLEYEPTLAAAKAVLLRTGSQVDATKLSAHALNQLVVFGEHLRRHSETRPK